MIELRLVKNSDPSLRAWMRVHYSAPKGFVGRNLCYLILVDGVCYGATVAGSATRFLPGREQVFPEAKQHLNNYVNNTFYHLDKPEGVKYPLRNFATAVVKAWRQRLLVDWPEKYGDLVHGFETLVEPPRTGECYLRDGWTLVGKTQGFTCKRGPGKGTDSWSGKRVWDTVNLRPKLVLVRPVWPM